MTSHALLKKAYETNWQNVSAEDFPKIFTYFKKNTATTEDFQEILSEMSLFQAELPFYPDWKLLGLLNDKGYGPLARFALLSKKGDSPVILDWTAAPIEEINEKAPLLLTEKTALDYARFFLSFVKGAHGRFKIVETGRDMPWKRGIKGNKKAKAIQAMIPATATKIDDTLFQIEASILFKEALVQTILTIPPTGLISMGAPDVKIDQLPIEPEQFLF